MKAAKFAAEHGERYGKEVMGFAALGAAQLSGFGVYMLGSTLLGAINSAFGLGLGFGAFTGLSSLVSLVIGPIGWAALGLFTVLKLGAPNYKKLLPVIILIATQRSIIDDPAIGLAALTPSLTPLAPTQETIEPVATPDTSEKDTKADEKGDPRGADAEPDSITLDRSTLIADRPGTDDTASVPRLSSAQRRAKPTQPRRFSNRDKLGFDLRNQELSRVSRELVPECRHFLELPASHQEIVRLLLAEREQLIAAPDGRPDAIAANGNGLKKSDSAAEKTITKALREPDPNQLSRRYQEEFPHLSFSVNALSRLDEMPQRNRECFESEFGRMKCGSLKGKHDVPGYRTETLCQRSATRREDLLSQGTFYSAHTPGR